MGTEIQNTQGMKIAGADSTGDETRWVDATTFGLKQDLFGVGGSAITLGQKTQAASIPHTLSMDNPSDVTSAARTTSGNSGTLDSYGHGSISATLSVTAVSGTTPKLDIDLELSDDGSNWRSAYSFLRVTASTTLYLRAQRLSTRYYRYKWTIAGTSPSFTFSITTTLKQFLSPRTLALNQYSALDLTTVGNVSTAIDVEGFSTITIHSNRGADGGNNGQWFIEASQDLVNWDTLTANITQGVNTSIETSVTGGTRRYMRFQVKAATNAGTRVVDLLWSGV